VVTVSSNVTATDVAAEHPVEVLVEDVVVVVLDPVLVVVVVPPPPIEV
jgi:hypothetical protein